MHITYNFLFYLLHLGYCCVPVCPRWRLIVVFSRSAFLTFGPHTCELIFFRTSLTQSHSPINLKTVIVHSLILLRAVGCTNLMSNSRPKWTNRRYLYSAVPVMAEQNRRKWRQQWHLQVNRRWRWRFIVTLVWGGELNCSSSGGMGSESVDDGCRHGSICTLQIVLFKNYKKKGALRADLRLQWPVRCPPRTMSDCP